MRVKHYFMPGNFLPMPLQQPLKVKEQSQIKKMSFQPESQEEMIPAWWNVWPGSGTTKTTSGDGPTQPGPTTAPPGTLATWANKKYQVKNNKRHGKINFSIPDQTCCREVSFESTGPIGQVWSISWRLSIKLLLQRQSQSWLGSTAVLVATPREGSSTRRTPPSSTMPSTWLTSLRLGSSPPLRMISWGRCEPLSRNMCQIQSTTLTRSKCCFAKFNFDQVVNEDQNSCVDATASSWEILVDSDWQQDETATVTCARSIMTYMSTPWSYYHASSLYN